MDQLKNTMSSQTTAAEIFSFLFLKRLLRMNPGLNDSSVTDTFYKPPCVSVAQCGVSGRVGTEYRDSVMI